MCGNPSLGHKKKLTIRQSFWALRWVKSHMTQGTHNIYTPVKWLCFFLWSERTSLLLDPGVSTPSLLDTCSFISPALLGFEEEKEKKTLHVQMDRFVNIAVPKKLSEVSAATDKGKELERWFRNVLEWHSCKTACVFTFILVMSRLQRMCFNWVVVCRAQPVETGSMLRFYTNLKSYLLVNCFSLLWLCLC